MAVILVLSPCRWASVPARGKCLWIPPCLCLFASIVSAVIVSGDSFLWCVCMCVPVFQETALAEHQYAGSGATRCCFTSVANHNASQPSACLPGTPAGLHSACWAALPLGENSHLQIKHNPKHGDVLSKQRLPVLSPEACPHHPNLTPQAVFVLSTCSSLWLNASIPTLDKSELTEILPAAHLPHVKALVYSLPIVGLCKWCSANRRQVHVMLWFKYLMKKLRLFASSLPRCSLGE